MTFSLRAALSLLAVAALILSGAFSGSAYAGGATECYEAVPPKLVHRNWQRRDIVLPGEYQISREPAQYGFRLRKIIVDPGKVVWHDEPPVYKTVTKKVKVGGGYVWKYCPSGHREVKCRVKVPARYEVVEKQVLVKEGRRWSESTPPQVGYVQERVLLKPYRNYNTYVPAEISNYNERVAIQPEGQRWVRTDIKPDC